MSAKWKLKPQVMLGAGLLLLTGVGIGLLIPTDTFPVWIGGPTQTPTSADQTAGSGHGGSVFDVSLAAQESMQLRIGNPQLGNYTETVSLPAIVRERPAVSNLQVSSKLAGIVTRIYVDVGQSVREGDRLLELELIDDRLAESQSALLDASKQLEILSAEINRIAPVANTGGVARKNLLEKQYELNRLRASMEAKRQELLVKGFSEEQIESITQQGELVRNLTIYVPTGIRPKERLAQNQQAQPNPAPQRPALTVAARIPSDDPWVYSIEDLHVSPGTMAQAGQPLCELSYHESLLLMGQAYERDVPLLTHLLQIGEGVQVSIGSDEAPEIMSDVPIIYMDNHVSPETQTIQFYVELQNTVTSEAKNANGFLFRSWKYRPAQRGHILLPAREWEDKLIVPSDAIARDGLDSVVFRHLGVHRSATEAAHSEFQKIVVNVVYSDRRNTIIEPGGYLGANDEIALSGGYMLQLQMNKSDSGGGHSHDH